MKHFISKVVLSAALSAATLLGANSAIAGGDLQAERPAIWSGFYAGAFAGWAGAEVDFDDIGLNEFIGDQFGHDVDGLAGGILIGYNFQKNNIVFGVEADIALTDISGRDYQDPTDQAIETEISSISTLNARLGLAQDNVLVYATAGLALARVSQYAGDTDSNGGNRYFDDDDAVFNTGSWETGYTLGAGIDVALGKGWAMGVQYKYIDLGSYDAVAPDDSGDTGAFDNEVHSVSARVIKKLY